ncbi:MAG: hypothetical protein E7158_01345 [Firmicutes bacterium]|nr:hypothetical protein [Bacillota bacterium]
MRGRSIMNKKLIVISAVWCPSCLLLKKDLKKLKDNYNDIEIETLDYDFDEDEVKKLEIGDKLPVVICYKEDKEISRLIGEKNYDEIVKFIKDCDLI